MNKRLARAVCAAVLGVSIAGCSTPYSTLRPEDIALENRARYGNKTIDNVLKEHFAKEAYDEIRAIPAEKQNVMDYSMAVGVNFWSSFASFFLLCGPEKKVLLSKSGLKKSSAISTIVHEYLHHADALGFINHDKFEKAYARLKNERGKNYDELVSHVEEKINDYPPFYFLFSIGRTSERIALVGERIATGTKVPDYLKQVYQDALK